MMIELNERIEGFARSFKETLIIGSNTSIPDQALSMAQKISSKFKEDPNEAQFWHA